MSVAAPYASALYAAAREAGRVDAVDRDLAAIAEAVADDPLLMRALANPAIPAEQKRNVLHAILDGADPLVRQTLDVMLEHRRLHLVGGLQDDFAERVRRDHNALAVELTTAVPIDDATAKRLEEQLAAATGSSIAMERTVDPSIIGGVVLRVRDRIVDASLRRRLDLLGRQLRGARIPTV